MISFANIWTFATAELSLTRRLTRYWVFLASAYLVATMLYIQYAALHAFFSSYSGLVSMANPRYTFGIIGVFYMAAFSMGIVFLGYDLRARDHREGIHEVLDARPVSNLELVAGRFLGLFLAAWIPVLFLILLLASLGLALDAADVPFGSPLEPRSLVSFALFLAVPAIAFCFALVFLITMIVRSRLLAAIVSIAALAGLNAVMFLGAYQIVPLVDFLAMTQIGMPSDLAPAIGGVQGSWLQRIGITVLAFGMLILTAAIHPRLDDGSRWRQSGAGMLVLLLGFACTLGAMTIRADAGSQLEVWRQAHVARVAEARPDVTAMKGLVAIDPGKSLAVELEIAFRAAPGQTLQRALFTLNPGLELTAAKTSTGQSLVVTHKDGLLELTLPSPLIDGASMNVALAFNGRPDLNFGYLDSAIAAETVSTQDGMIALLGYERGTFRGNFVALLPGLRWLPSAGADVERDDTRTHPRDYFDVDLTVSVPTGWLAAGPGAREPVADPKLPDTVTSFRFAPQTPIPEVALVAAEFVSYSTQVKGVTLEALVHPKHAKNFDVFATIKDELAAAIEDKLTLAEQAGMPYPFSALTLVEVPAGLRSYEGGWRMNSVAPPSILLMRESGLPTARFDVAYRQEAMRRLEADERGARAKRERLEEFFFNDFTGGNVFLNTARSFYAHQTSATGPEALALNFAMDELATLVIAGRRGYFSAHLFDGGLNARIATTTSAYNSRRPRELTFADVVIQSFASRREVWDHVLSASLVELDPSQEPDKALDILTLKAGAIAQVIYEELGPDDSARLLGSLIAKHRGSSFTIADFKHALAEHASETFITAFDDLLYGTRLPGFVTDNVQFYRLNDTADGNPRYQLLVRVRNDEPASGSIRIAWLELIDRTRTTLDFANLRRVTSDLIPMAGHSAIEFGVVLPYPPVSIYVEPSFSLNRTSFLAEFLRPKDYVEPRATIDPIEGVSAVPWKTETGGRVSMDDLDAGFSIRQSEAAQGTRLGRASAAVDAAADLDSGLVVATVSRPTMWSRREEVTAAGRYRHTIAYRRPGDGSSQAAFSAKVPEAGAYQLEVHLPNLPFIAAIATWGTWELRIQAQGLDENFTFATRSGTIGWNLMREVNLPAGEITVLLSDKTDGRLVVADAMRLSPISRSTVDRDSAKVQAN